MVIKTRTMTVRATDTDPLIIWIDARRVSDLSDLSSAKLYLWERGSDTNHVDGEDLTVEDSDEQTLRFDPVDAAEDDEGNAIDALQTPGVYLGYVEATWTGGRTSRHPGGKSLLKLEVLANAPE